MTQKTIYGSDGMIVRVVTLTGDPVDDAIIEDIPVGGASVDGYYDSDTVYFVAGVATARPAVVVDPAYEIVADGEDSFWFEVPDETHISTSEGYFESTFADALVSVSSRLIGPQRILIVPPLPYQKTAIMVSVVSDDGGAPNLPPTTPDIEILFSQTVLTNLAVLAKPKFNVVSWDISSDPEHAYYGLTRYESEADADADTAGVDIEPITDTFYKDADEFVNGVDCWYRVYDVDTNDNRSEKSDPAGEVARGVQTGDIEDNAATPSKVYYSDPTNQNRDPDMRDISLWVATAEAGQSITAFDVVLNPTSDGYGGSKYRLEATATGGDETSIATLPYIVVSPGSTYFVNAFIGPKTSTIATPDLFADFYSIDSSGDLVLEDSDHIPPLSPSFGGPVTGVNIYGYTTVPAGCVRMAIRGDGGAVDVMLSDLQIRRLPSIYFQEYTAANYGSFNTTQQSIQTKAIDHGPAVAGVEVTGSFRNTSAGVKSFLIELYAGSTMIAEMPACEMRDNGYQTITGIHANPEGTSTTYTLRVTGTASGNNVANRRLICKVVQ